MNNIIFKSYSVLALLLCGTFSLFAQLPPPQGAPIDGGVSALVIGASAYIGKKLYDKKKKGE